MVALFGVDVLDLQGIASSPGGSVAVTPGANTVGLAVIAAVSAAISAGYFIFQWSSAARATLGMRLLNLQLGDAVDGRTISRGRAARRWLALAGWAAVLGIVPQLSVPVAFVLLVWEVVLLISVVSSPAKQGLHDRVAGTAMVQPAGGSGNALVVGCLVVIGFVILISLVSVVALIFLGSQVSTILDQVGHSI